MTEIRCAYCGTDTTATPVASCPSCGRAPRDPSDPLAPASFSPLQPIRRYFFDLWQIITRPTRFFSRMPLTGGVSGPLAFALVTHWLGSAVGYLWLSVMGSRFFSEVGGGLRGLMNMAGDVVDVDSPGRSQLIFEAKDRLMHWLWGAGSIILDPFLTLTLILFTSFFVFIGARILVTPGKNGAPRTITFESALRIICFGMSPAILAAVPFVGGIVSQICVVIVTVIAGREVYKVSSSRATVVVLFPKLLFLGIIMSGVLFLALAFFKLVTSMI